MRVFHHHPVYRAFAVMSGRTLACCTVRASSAKAVVRPSAVSERSVIAYDSRGGGVVSRLEELRKRLRYEDSGISGHPHDHPAPKVPPPPLAGGLSVPSTAAAGGGILLDSFGRKHTYLRVSLTERCNLRCTYCMPVEGVPLSPSGSLLTLAELKALLATFVHDFGVKKVRLTGGEPTIRPDLVEIVDFLAQQRQPGGLDVIGMTSNGIKLGAPSSGPRLLRDLHSAGLSHLNLSLDTLQRGRFPAVSLRSEEYWDRAWSALETACAMGFRAVKVNCVVVRGVNDDEIADFVALTLRLPISVRFIEVMPFNGNNWSERALVPFSEQLDVIKRAYPNFAPLPRISSPAPFLSPTASPLSSRPSTHAAEERSGAHADGSPAADHFIGGGGGGSGGTSSEWHIPGAPGVVGFITTMTDAFCSSCTRLRLTADGSIKACLHGDEEVSLREALRQPTIEEGGGGGGMPKVRSLIMGALYRKHAALGGKTHKQLGSAVGTGRPMIKIGG